MTNFTQDDLIAYQLHELSPRRERALRNALANNPDLAQEAEAIAFTLRAFDPKSPTPLVDAALLDRAWQTLRPSLAVHSTLPRFQRWRTPLSVAAGLSLAAATVLWFTLWSNSPRSTHTLSQDLATTQHAIPTSSVPTNSPSPTRPTPGPAEASRAASHAGQPVLTTGQGSTPANQPPSLLSRATEPASQSASRITHNPAEDVALAARAGSRQPLAIDALTPSTQLALQPQEPFSTNTLSAMNYPAPSLPPIPQPAAAPATRTRSRKPQFPVESDLSVGAFASLTLARLTSITSDNAVGTVSIGTSTITDTKYQSAPPAGGGIVTFHQQRSPLLGYQATFAFNSVRLEYNDTSTQSPSNAVTTASGAIPATVFEASAAYVAQGPHTRRISTHAGAGLGLLDFVPTDSAQATGHTLRPALVTGASLNYRIHRHWSLRAEYRALFFQGPDFNTHNTTIPLTTRYTVASQPVLSLTYNFNNIKP